MGTTAQKLEYLGTTKSQLKDMINYGLPSEQQITSSTTFRNYVSSIFNAFLEALRTPDTLFTNLPKKSGTGANITLNDTANAPMRITLGASELIQDGTPTPSSPQDIHTISGSNKVVVSNSDNTISQEAEVDLGNIEYSKIGNYEDKFIRSNDGTWQLEKNIGKVVLDGTANSWQVNSAYTTEYMATKTDLGINLPQNSTDFISSHFIAKSGAPATLGSIRMGGTYVCVNYDDGVGGIDNFKTWLSNNNVLVYYALSTPTYTQITGTLAEQLENVYQKLLSYTGTTNISQINNDLSFVLSVQAIEE